MHRRILALSMAICLAVMSFPLEIYAEEAAAALSEAIEEISLPEATATPAPTDAPAEPTASPAPSDAPTEPTASPVPSDAPAEPTASPEPSDVPAEATASPVPSDTPAESTASPAPSDAPAEPTASPAPTDAPAEATASPAPMENPIDTGKDASFSPAFEQGYAEILHDDAEVQPKGDDAFLLPRGAVVYASARDNHLMEIWLDTPGGVLFGETEDKNLRPMSAEEIQTFTDAQRSRENIHFMDEDELLPLALIENVVFPDDAQPVHFEIVEEHISGRAGETFALTVKTNTDEIVWTSSDEAVAVCDSGTVRLIGAGTCEITAVAESGTSDSCTVKVIDAPETLTLPYETLTIGVGESFRLEPDVGGAITTFTYASSKPKYAKVSADGVVKGVKKGTSVIGVRTHNGLDAYVAVRVLTAPKSVTVSPKTLILGAGETGRLNYALPKNTAGTVTFVSSNPEIASVNAATGEIIAVSAGTVKIGAVTFNGKKAYASVEVKKAPENVSVIPEATEIGVGQILSVKTSVNTGAAGAVTLSSSDESRLIVSGSQIKGVAEGTAEIIATAYNGVVCRTEITVRPAPEKVTLPFDSISIGAGEIIQLTPDCGDAVGGFVYASSKPKYAAVAQDGRIRGMKRGTAKIRVSTYNGKEAYLTVKVGIAPSKITLSHSSFVLGAGETARLGFTLPKNAAGSVTFASSNPEIAAVNASTGEITAVSPGTAKITAQTYNGKKAHASVEVKSAPESVDMQLQSTTIGVGQILSVNAAVNAGAAGKVTLRSGDESRLIVSGNQIKGVAAGTATLTASAYNGVSHSIEISVLPAPAKVTLPYSTLKIGVGETLRLEPDAGDGFSGFTFASNKTKYVKVNAEGTILGVKKGTAKVGVSTYNGKKAYVTVQVLSAPKAVAISDSELDLGVGQTHRLLFRLPDNSAGAVRFESADPSVASVDETTGMITAVAPGKTEIAAITYNGKTARCAVRVSKAPDSISLGIESAEMGVGQSLQLTCTLPEDSKTTLSYSGSDESVLSVSDSGKITALRRGTAVVRAQTHVPGVFAEAKITVLDAPKSVSLPETEMRVLIGQTFALQPVIPEGCFGGFEFASSNPEVAAIDAEGTVKTLSVGKTTLAVRTYNGKTASAELTVWDPEHPEKIVLLNAPDVLNLSDGTYAVEYRLEPETAVPELVWTSSNPDVATVDNNGLITLHSYGYSVITVVSAKNSSVGAQFTLGVQLENLTLAIPKRVTQEDGIKANLAMIDNVRKSAIAQVDALKKGGVIDSSDASKRKSMINNIFADYAFPWKTPELQPYWKAANSEGGVKDFKPDRVYYGMPYTSGGSSNRRYNSAKAVAEKRYVDTGKGYYMLNRSKPVNGTYVGNDCSSLVSMAVWGTNSSHSYDRTGIIATTPVYRTVKGYKDMRPGDLLCKANRHVVMFLYYTNPEKTKIMIIENGGDEAGTNTVHCDVHELSYYTEIGYQVRRLDSLG